MIMKHEEGARADGNGIAVKHLRSIGFEPAEHNERFNCAV